MDDFDVGFFNYCQVGGFSFYYIFSFRFCGFNKEVVLFFKGEKNFVVYELNVIYYFGIIIIFDSRIFKLY